MRAFFIKNRSIALLAFMLLVIARTTQAETQTTNRIAQFSNKQVNVWETMIYPASKQALKMHRHEHDRVVVALTNGVLKITNDKGKIHYFMLKKDKAYYLAKDTPNELHMDENITHHPIKVMVIEIL